jgi:hypothetical protein
MTPEDLNHWLMEQRDPERPGRPIRAFICPDGFAVSIQANNFAYCSPSEDGALWYDSVELGYPNRDIPAWLPFAEDPERPMETVYGFVPTELVAETLTKHGA